MVDSENKLPSNPHIREETDPENKTGQEKPILNEKDLKSYLLGKLNLEEHLRLEHRIFSDETAFETLEAIEDELIEDYAEGALSDDERKIMETSFIWTPERQKKFNFAGTMKRYAAENGTVHRSKKSLSEILQAFLNFRNPVPAWATAALMIVLVAGGIWSANRISRLELALEQSGTGDVPQQQLTELQNRNSELAATLKEEQAVRNRLEEEITDLRKNAIPEAAPLLAGQSQSILLATVLPPSRIRGNLVPTTVVESNPKISIPPSTDLLKLELTEAPEGYARYSATIETVEGSEIWSQEFPAPESTGRQQSLTLTLPVEILEFEDYVLSLSGIADDGNTENTIEYSFRIRD